MLPSSYVKIVDNDETVVDDNEAPAPPPQQQNQMCLDQASCPYAQQQRPSSSLEKHRSSFSMKTGSQSTLNTVCSSRKSQHLQQLQQQQQQQHLQQNAFYNRLYNSDPSTNMIGTHSNITNDDSEYLSNYAHIKHSHRHSHYHLRRQSQPEEPRLMSRNSSSVKSFTSQCFINPEYFYEIRPSRSCDDSKASLISHKASHNQIMLLNSELHLLENLRGSADHSHSYPKINYLDKHYLLDDAAPPLSPLAHVITNAVVTQEHDRISSSSSSETSDVSEFHENKTSTLEKKRKAFELQQQQQQQQQQHQNHQAPTMYSETDSYSTVNDEITQLVSKHLSNSIKQLVARRFTDIESYTLPLKRRHSCDSSELSDIIIPDLFNSPSRIKWNFLTGLPDRSRSQSQIYSSDYKTDDDDDDEGEGEEEEEEEEEEEGIDEVLRKKSSSFDAKYHPAHREMDVFPLWRTNSYGRARDDCNTNIYHHIDDSSSQQNFCATHYRSRQQHGIARCSSKKDEEDDNEKVEEDQAIYEFELCTKENCEYLSKSQINRLPSIELQQQQHNANKNVMNNEIPSLPCTKNINLKHNKFKKLKKSKKSSSTQKENREARDIGDDGENAFVWNKINLNNLMKKESCNINSVNLKPHSSSSSSSSLNHGGNRNLKRHQKACDKLFSTSLSHRQQQTLNVTSLILATSSNSTQARIRNDGGIYFSNPDLSSIPADLRSMNFINNNSNNTSNNNNSCQFINNDLRSNIVNSRSRFDSRFNNLNSATNYLLESINSNNIDNSNNSEIMQQQDLRRRLRYINLHGMIRRAQRRAKKYLNSISFASRK